MQALLPGPAFLFFALAGIGPSRRVDGFERHSHRLKGLLRQPSMAGTWSAG